MVKHRHHSSIKHNFVTTQSQISHAENATVEWSPSIPGGVLVTSPTGGISIVSCLNNVQKSKYVPLWYKREACGATFGFGGKLAQWGRTIDANAILLTFYTDSVYRNYGINFVLTV